MRIDGVNAGTDERMAAGSASDSTALVHASWAAAACALVIAVVYAHDALPYLTMMPRVNIDEPWLMERAYQVLLTGAPRQPMYLLDRGYLLNVGYPYLLAGWMTVVGAGVREARLLAVLLGFGTLVMVGLLGRRLVGRVAGLTAPLFLAADSNFLGTARFARTDMPAVFFAAAALACYAEAQRRERPQLFAASGVCAALAVMCHGNAVWVPVVLGVWLIVDRGRRVLTDRRAYSVAAGAALAIAPYGAVVLTHLEEVRRQVNAFVPERVPFYMPSQVFAEIAREGQRYRDWYFGLVTSTVPNPLLWVFQAAVAAGLVVLAVRVVRRRATRDDLLLLTLATVPAVFFAAFVNNKVPVYMAHLLIGFSLAAAAAIHVGLEAIAALLARQARRALVVPAAALVFVVAYGGAATAYYEKWYSTVRKSELRPYEETAATVRTLLPAGTKRVIGAPQFWPPFQADRGARYISYAVGADAVPRDAPFHLLVDESQWLPDMRSPEREAFRARWRELIERHCALEAMAPGTAYGTIAAYACAPDRPPAIGAVRIVAGAADVHIGERVANFTAADLATWPRRTDPRRTPDQRPEVALAGDVLHIFGTGWPGIVLDFPATVGDKYLVRVDAAGAQAGDLLYLGTWQPPPQVRSLAGGSSAGMPTPLAHEPWFPGDRAFIATAARVPIAIYSEAPRTDFTVSSVQIFRLLP